MLYSIYTIIHMGVSRQSRKVLFRYRELYTLYNETNFSGVVFSLIVAFTFCYWSDEVPDKKC